MSSCCHVAIETGCPITFSGFPLWLFRRRHFRVALLTLLACGVTGQLIAVPINYGDLSGTSVIYRMVREDTPSGDTQPLYGNPTIVESPFPALPCTPALCTLSGNTLMFEANTHQATSTNGSLADITDGQLLFTVEAKEGTAIQNIQINEFGDTTLAGLGSNATSSMARMSVTIDIEQVDGVGINPIKLNEFSTPALVASFTPSGGSYKLGDQGGGPFFQTDWSGELFIDLQSVLTSQGISFTRGITQITVNLNNALAATSQAETSSEINKLGFSVTTNIPEPTTLAVALFATLTGFCLRVKRR